MTGGSEMSEPGGVTGTLATYIAEAARRPLPEDVQLKAKQHLLDTIAACVSGSQLPAGLAALPVLERFASTAEATVIGADVGADIVKAAFANGMAAHGDETDDSHEASLIHPGCAVVPAALAVAQHHHRGRDELVRAVALGYDVAARMTRALWPDNEVLRTNGRSTHAIGGLFGAAASAASLMRLAPRECAFVLSFAAQEASATRTWTRDVEHIEKAYVFGGMPAMTGTWVASLVAAGMPGVRDVFSGRPNFFDIIGIDPDPSALIEGLGSRYEIMATNIKRYCVGSPAQAPIDALLRLMEQEGLVAQDVARVTLELPDQLAAVVLGRDMPNINLGYLSAVALADGDVSFAAAHDEERFARWLTDPDPRITIERSPTMAPVRQALATIVTVEGREVHLHVDAVRGAHNNRMTTEEVEAKALDLLAQRYPEDRARELVDRVMGPLDEQDVAEWHALLGAG